MIKRLGGWTHIMIVCICVSLMSMLIFGLIISSSEQVKANNQIIEKVVIVKPQLPKVVRHHIFDTSGGANQDQQMDDYVTKCIKDGYIIKSVTSEGYSWYVIAEKY